MIKTRKIDRALNKKGFTKDSSKDHHYFYLIVEGRKTSVYTRMSHGESEISKNLESLMARQLYLSKEQFKNLVDCPMTEQDFLRHLRSENIIS